MTMTSGTLVAALIVLIALSIALYIPSIRARLAGGGTSRTALIPLLVAGVLWGTGAVGDLLRARIEESTVPSDVLSVRIQAVEFGLPQIPDQYQHMDMDEASVTRALAPLSASSDPITLTDDEFETLNGLSDASITIDSFDKSAHLTGAGVARLLGPGLSIYFDYLDWAPVASSWSQALASAETTADRRKSIAEFIDLIGRKPTSNGMFAALATLISRGTIDTTAQPGDCLTTPLDLVQVADNDNRVEIQFQQFTMRLPGGSRADGSHRVADLLRYGCLKQISSAFLVEAKTLTAEADLIRRYVDEWNRILASREAQSIRLRVAISNIGKYDSFIQNEAKAVVGMKGNPSFSFIVQAASPKESTDAEASSGAYLEIRSRETQIFEFSGQIPEDIRPKLHGAYASDENLIRLGIIASAGAGEAVVLSDVTEFSEKAAETAKTKVENLKVAI